MTKSSLHGAEKSVNGMSIEEKREPAKQLRDELAKGGKTLNKLEIAKSRGGVRRGNIELTFWFRQSSFTQGVDR
jgi:hypothetical protein